MKMPAILRCDRGVAAVEFAIVSMVFFTLVIGGIDMGRTFYIKNQLSHLADQASRSVLMDPDVSDTALTNFVQTEFSAGDAGQITVTVTSETAAGIEYRVIRIDYPMTLFIPNLTSQTFGLNVDRRVPIG